ncbi:MAG TPA: APC family permease [Mycobacteriales bacterium]|nr:APC family permease [Mycobacteriales bacterium]
MRSTQLGETLLPKKIALPVFASDALSSVAYATEEILLVLSAGGLALIHFTWYAAAGVAFLMLVVVASYRQNVHAYPSGGGDYEVATKNLGRPAGITVASALMVDYVLTVAVSVSSGVANITSAVDSLQGHEVQLAVSIVAVITLLNLRGLRESGTAFAIPTYAFMLGVFALIVIGVAKLGSGRDLHASTEHLRYTNAEHFAGLALVFLLLRAFASGCTALTGVEAISNGVPAFKQPKEKNAATTLALLGAIAVSMFIAITAFAIISHVHTAADPTDLGLAPDAHTPTVIAQVGAAIFGGYHSLGFYYLQGVTALILVLAANTAFNGFPVLASILARDGFLPRQLHTRGDRLAFSNGILLLAGFAILLIVAFSASPTRLIQLYIVGVFVSFVNSQTGMIRHWNRHLPHETDHARRRQMQRSRVINSVGAVVTSLVLVIIVISKFTEGAWIAVVAMGVLFLLMRGIRRHYDNVKVELAPTDEAQTLPSRVHAIVLVSKVHKATLRAVAYARATRPSTLEAVTVDVDAAETKALQEEWDGRNIPVSLKILESPYREVTKPILDYVRNIRRQSPRDLVTVFIPEYVVGHWWEQLLHNQSALRLKGRLLFTPGIMVVSVPYQLASSDRRVDEDERPAAGAVRRGAADSSTVR